ncbi:MAG: HD domain-containing protein, partial [Ginsengibacter sp.]
PSAPFNNFLHKEFNAGEIERYLDDFCLLDDCDVLSAIKSWTLHPDKILSFLCDGIVNRRLLKVKYFGTIIDNKLIKEKTELAIRHFQITKDDAGYLVFTGEAGNKTYSNLDDHINILFKSGAIKDISEVDNALINQTLFGTAKKFYICFPNVEIL